MNRTYTFVRNACEIETRKRLCKNRRFRYIASVWRDNYGFIIVCGQIGMRRYLYYPVREAVKAYNQECRKYA